MKRCLQELRSSSCLCWFSYLLFPQPFLFNTSQPFAQWSFFPCFDWNFQLCFTKRTLSWAVKMQLLDAGLWSPCWGFLFSFNNSLPKEGSWNGTHTSSALCKATASLGLVWCPLLVHPLDLFAFICTVGNCEHFMIAITNKASQEGIPGDLWYFQLGRLASGVWGLILFCFSWQILFANTSVTGLHFYFLFYLKGIFWILISIFLYLVSQPQIKQMCNLQFLNYQQTLVFCFLLMMYKYL